MLMCCDIFYRVSGELLGELTVCSLESEATEWSVMFTKRSLTA